MAECEVDDFVGCVEDAGGIALATGGFVGEGEAGEAVEVRSLKTEVWHVPPVDAWKTAFQSLGVGESQLYRDAHVGHPELGFDGSVFKLDGAVYDALWVYYDLYALGLYVEEPLGFDDF